MSANGLNTVRFGQFEFDLDCEELRKDGVRLKVHGQPLRILGILIANPGELVSREDFRQSLWSNDTFVDFEHSLNTAIKKLRRTLGDQALQPLYIETVPKRGYRFIGEVSHNGAKQPGQLQTSTFGKDVPNAAVTPEDHATSPEKKSSPSLVWMFVALCVFGILVVAATAYWTMPPMPRIVRSYALTKTGLRKTPEYQSRVLNDGLSVYFQEIRQSRVATMRVPVQGGEPTELQSSLEGSLLDISPDGSEALFAVPSAAGFDAWGQPLPAGTPRLIIKDARFPTWTADGRNILFARAGDRELWQVNADGTGTRRLSDLPDISDIFVSPRGDHIRVNDMDTGTLWETGPDGSNRQAVLQEVVRGRWSADSKYFFFSMSSDQGNLWVRAEDRSWRRRNRSVKQLTFGPLSIGAPAVSKDGKHLYAVGREPHGELSVYDAHAGAFVPFLGGIAACYVDFSRDGQWITYVSYPEGTLWRSRIDGSERRQLTVPPMLVINPRWSPDGKLIAFTGLHPRGRRGVRQTLAIYTINAEGGGPTLLPTDQEQPADPTWSPDGKSIAYCTAGGFSGRFHEVWILDLKSHKSSKVPGSDGLWSARWSPDGKYLAAVGGNPSKLWLYSFKTQKWSDLASGNPNWPAWSSDSRFVHFAQSSSASLARINVLDHTVEETAPIKGVPSVAVPYSSWAGVTLDGRPVITRDTGIEEVYAFDLEYK